MDSKHREIWMPVKGYEGLYEVSNLGRLKSLPRKGTRGGIIAPTYTNTKHYAHVVLAKNAKGRTMSLHRIVAEAFISNPDNKPQVNHKDGNKRNNAVDNLEWATQEENMQHAFRTGLKDMKAAVAARSRSVAQIFEGKVIKTFPSVREAERATGASNQNIIKVCQGTRRMAGGFEWRYT